MTSRSVPDGVRLGTEADARSVAALHVSELPEGFLVTLGTPFLVRLYTRIARYRGSFLLVIGDADDIQGFAAVAERTGDLYREFLRRDGLRAGIAALPSIVRAPRHVWETLRYGTLGHGDGAELPDAEVLSMGVAASARGQGLGRTLVVALQEELGRRGIHSAHLVSSIENDAAHRMFEAEGFTRGSTMEVHAGVTQVVLTWP